MPPLSATAKSFMPSTAKSFVQGEIPLPLSDVESDLARQASAWVTGGMQGNQASKDSTERYYTGYFVPGTGGGSGNASITATDFALLKAKWEGKLLLPKQASLFFRVAMSGSGLKTNGAATRYDFILQDLQMKPAHIFVFHIDVL